MNNNPVLTNPRAFWLTQSFLTGGCTTPKLISHTLPLVATCVLLVVTPVFADLEQVFVDGQAGRFQEAQSALHKMSLDLEAQVTSADLTIVGRNCAAIGFYSLLSQVSSDCISNVLSPDHGKQLFTAAEKAASGQLTQAESLAKEVAVSNPDYPQAQILLARIYMGNCMQHDRNCNEAIETYRKALGIDKTLAVAYLDLGMLYQHVGKNQEAIAVLGTATTEAPGHAATKWAHLMLALLYSTEAEWTQAKIHAEKARDLGFTGFAAGLLDEIQGHIGSDSTSEGQRLSIETIADSNSTKPVGDEKSEPDFMTGLGHGLTSPLRFFGFFDLHYVNGERRTGSYSSGVLIGCLVILSIGLGLFKK